MCCSSDIFHYISGFHSNILKGLIASVRGNIKKTISVHIQVCVMFIYVGNLLTLSANPCGE